MLAAPWVVPLRFTACKRVHIVADLLTKEGLTLPPALHIRPPPYACARACTHTHTQAHASFAPPPHPTPHPPRTHPPMGLQMRRQRCTPQMSCHRWRQQRRRTPRYRRGWRRYRSCRGCGVGGPGGSRRCPVSCAHSTEGCVGGCHLSDRWQRCHCSATFRSQLGARGGASVLPWLSMHDVKAAEHSRALPTHAIQTATCCPSPCTYPHSRPPSPTHPAHRWMSLPTWPISCDCGTCGASCTSRWGPPLSAARWPWLHARRPGWGTPAGLPFRGASWRGPGRIACCQAQEPLSARSAARRTLGWRPQAPGAGRVAGLNRVPLPPPLRPPHRSRPGARRASRR